MQFMHGTWPAYGGMASRFEAKASIAAGARYMRRLWRIYHAQNRPPGDRLAFAFMAYNAGAGSVIRFRKSSAMHRAQPSLGRRSALLPGKSPANTLSALSAGAPALVEKACTIRCPRPVPKKNEVLEMLDKRVEEMDKSELSLFISLAEEEVAFVKKS